MKFTNLSYVAVNFTGEIFVSQVGLANSVFSFCNRSCGTVFDSINEAHLFLEYVQNVSIVLFAVADLLCILIMHI